MSEEKFEYTYTAPTKSEREEIEDIRKHYLKKTDSESKLERLKSLDNKVKNIPTVISLTVGIVGVLIFGLGLTMILEWNIMIWGVVVCTMGCIVMIPAYFIFKSLKQKLTAKYKDEILTLSDELLGEDNKN